MSVKLSILGLCASLALAAPALAGPEDVEDVRNLERSFYAAFVESDDEAMADLFAPDFTYQHGSGATFNKMQFVSFIESGAIRVSRADTPSMTVRDLGDTILTFGNGIVEGTAGEDAFAIDLRFINVWHRHDGSWKLVHRNSEALPSNN